MKAYLKLYHETTVKIRRKSEFCGLVGEIFLYHKSNLKGNRVIKLAEIESCELSDLLKTVNESVAVYEKLS